VIADGLAGLLGGLFSEGWLKRNLAALVGFAAGALLAAVFLDALPEAIHTLNAQALYWAFGGFIALALVEWFLGRHHHEHGTEHKAVPSALLLSDALHNMGDGAAIAAGFLVSHSVGFGVALAVIAHEVPQEIGDYALLRAHGMSRIRALFWLAMVQLTAAVGAVGAYLASSLTESLNAILIAIASGTFLYIGATDLLPEIHLGPKELRYQRLAGFLLGLALVFVASFAEAH
jgi:zinc and cadmium transporter